jgi:hypothetical protein
VRLEGLGQLKKKINYLIGTRIPTTLPRVPTHTRTQYIGSKSQYCNFTDMHWQTLLNNSHETEEHPIRIGLCLICKETFCLLVTTNRELYSERRECKVRRKEFQKCMTTRCTPIVINLILNMRNGRIKMKFN